MKDGQNGGSALIDDEELSYSGYSEETAERMENSSAVYRGDDEEYSYTGYASEEDFAAQSLVGDDAQSEIAAGEATAYGDFILEEYSAESTAKKVSKYIRLPENLAKYVLAAIYLAVGLVCVIIPHDVESVLPYIVGGMLAAVALARFVFAIIEKEYRSTHSNKTASSLILMGLSVMILLEHDWAHTFIPIVWGVIGLAEGAHAFNHALSRISRGMRSAYYIIKGIVEVVVAFLLLYKPEEYAELHIIVFGVSLILDGITVMPIVKKFVARQ